MDDNIVLFPRVKEKLKLDIKVHMENDEFMEALEKLNILLKHDYHSYMIHVQTLTCLIKLRQFADAEYLCEELLENRNGKHYYDYFDYYVMILYEATKYSKLIDRIEKEEKLGLPTALKFKTEEIKRLAMQMNEWKKSDLLKEFQESIKLNDSQKQYVLLQKWQQHNLKPTTDFYHLLNVNTIHPIIKTIIFLLLKEDEVEKSISVKKFGKTEFFTPENTYNMMEHPIYQTSLTFITELEQKNPTLYFLAKELLDQYCFVLYPFVFEEDKAKAVSEKIVEIAKVNLSIMEPNNELDQFTEQIQICHRLYQEIMLQ